jgi:hypothetical protein
MATPLDWLKSMVSKDSTAGKLRDRKKKIDSDVDDAEGNDGYDNYKSAAEDAGERVISRDEYRRKYKRK